MSILSIRRLEKTFRPDILLPKEKAPGRNGVMKYGR